MKDIEIRNVFRNDSGNVLRVEVLADYHMDFSFILRRGEIVQVSGGPIHPKIYKRMMKQVYAIFHSSYKDSIFSQDEQLLLFNEDQQPF